MTQTPLKLDVDLRIEHAGHQLDLKGSGQRFVARFRTLRGLIHFGRLLWPLRKQMPKGWVVRIVFRGIGMQFKAAT